MQNKIKKLNMHKHTCKQSYWSGWEPGMEKSRSHPTDGYNASGKDQVWTAWWHLLPRAEGWKDQFDFHYVYWVNVTGLDTGQKNK